MRDISTRACLEIVIGFALVAAAFVGGDAVGRWTERGPAPPPPPTPDAAYLPNEQEWSRRRAGCQQIPCKAAFQMLDNTVMQVTLDYDAASEVIGFMGTREAGTPWDVLIRTDRRVYRSPGIAVFSGGKSLSFRFYAGWELRPYTTYFVLAGAPRLDATEERITGVAVIYHNRYAFTWNGPAQKD